MSQRLAHLIKALRVGLQFSTKKNIKEEEEYRGAIDRYLRGNADMSCQVPLRYDANVLSRYSFPQVKCRMEQCKANYLYGQCLFTAQVFV